MTDEFMEPISVLTPEGAHLGRVEDGDALIFFNFRADRMRQIVTAFKDDALRRLPSRGASEGASGDDESVSRGLRTCRCSSRRSEVKNHLGEVLSRAGLKQLRIAETEKYAHVTFFFNGGSDTKFAGEERMLVPSPKVATYDLQAGDVGVRS